MNGEEEKKNKKYKKERRKRREKKETVKRVRGKTHVVGSLLKLHK